MFHSGSSSNGSTLQEADKLLLQDSYTYNENPSSRNALENSTPFMHFPASFLDEDDELLVSQWLSQHQHQQQQEVIAGSSSLAETEGSTVVATQKAEENHVNQDNSTSNINAAADEHIPPKEVTKNKGSKGTKQQSAPRKRSGKKDRHSKIYTAQGPRDRRMRLSLQIARKFFDLQDMLGFDKASKTIEWLLTTSKCAIKELTKNLQQAKPGSRNGAKSISSTSENEVVSEIKNNNVEKGESSSMAKSREKKERKVRKSVLNPLAKESRDKARARARERTREKMKSIGLQEQSKQSSETNPSGNLKQIKVDGTIEEMNSSLTAMVDEKSPNSIQLIEAAQPRIDSLSIVENFLGATTGPLPTFSSSSSYANVAVFSGTNSKDALTGNWEIDKAGALNNYHSITNMKYPAASAVTGNFLVQYPTVAPITSQNVQERKTNSVSSPQGYHSDPIFMNSVAQRHNPRTIFTNTSITDQDRNFNQLCHEGYPNPVIMSTPDVYLQSRWQANQFFSNPRSSTTNKYHSLF